MLKALVTYLVVASLSWSPAREHLPKNHAAEDEAAVVAFREAVARDVAEVVLDPDEPAIFPRDPEKAETALQLVGMAFYEGRFWPYVDDGSCNSRSWKVEHKWQAGLCDGGRAWSLWQVQTKWSEPDRTPRDGIELVGLGARHVAKNGLVGKDLAADRKLAIRVSLHMMRDSLRTTHGLCGYTGESAMSGCPKAKARRELVKAYLRAYPFAAPLSGP